jgi:Heparinase II/III N-terminus
MVRGAARGHAAGGNSASFRRGDAAHAVAAASFRLAGIRQPRRRRDRRSSGAALPIGSARPIGMRSGRARKRAGHVRWAISFSGPGLAVSRRRCGRAAAISADLLFHDPITGKAWPDAAASSFDVDVRATGADIGDVKYVWEPSRLQMLHPLAAVIAATPASGPLRVATAIISSWMIANPPYRGVNWKSGIELALRLVSLTLFVAAARPATLSVAQRVMIRAMVLAHARYLAAFPSLHSSANNHRIAEGLGLFVAGVLLPDLAEARAWLDEGRRRGDGANPARRPWLAGDSRRSDPTRRPGQRSAARGRRKPVASRFFRQRADVGRRARKAAGRSGIWRGPAAAVVASVWRRFASRG